MGRDETKWDKMGWDEIRKKIDDMQGTSWQSSQVGDHSIGLHCIIVHNIICKYQILDKKKMKAKKINA